MRQAHRVRGLGLDCPASQLERPRGSGPGDDRDRRRDGERAPETQKKTHTHVLAPCPRPGPVSTVRPSYPAPPSWPCHLYPGHAIYPKPQRESTGAHDCDLVEEGRERTGRGPAEVAVGELELKNTLNTSPLQPPPMSPVPEAAGGNPGWGGSLSNHRDYSSCFRSLACQELTT